MRQQLKFITFWLFSAFIVSITSGCKENEEPPANLNVSISEIEVECDGESLSIEVSCNSMWSASSSASWVTITPSHTSGDGHLYIKVSPNSGGVRDAVIHFFIKNENEAKATVKVHQSALGEHSLSLSPMVVALENGNLEAKVDIEASNPHGWTFEIIEGGEWLEVSKGDNKLNIEADVLKVPYRTGQIDIVSAGNRKSVYVVQGHFREIDASSLTALYYGQLNEMPYTTALISVEGNKYASPFVGQDYQDYILLQLNIKPLQTFEEFSIQEGIYPILIQNQNETKYCSAGFFDEKLGVYGSCWLRRWFYMEQDYGFNSLNIFTEGNVYITTDHDSMSVYLAATGYDQSMEPLTYAMKISGDINYTNTTRSLNYNSFNGLLRQL